MAQQTDISKMETTQTAVEWLLDRFLFAGYGLPSEWREQAKAMEKRQIAKAWDGGNYQYFSSKITNEDFENGEEYYNETFNK